jgi:hypothetical protein
MSNQKKCETVPRLTDCAAFLSWLKLSVYMAIVSVAIVLSFHLKSEPTPLGKLATKLFLQSAYHASQKSVSHYLWASSFGYSLWHVCYQGCQTTFIRSHGIVSGEHWYKRDGRRKSYSRWYQVPSLQHAYCCFQPTQKREGRELSGILNGFNAVHEVS